MGYRLKEAREGKKITQEELSKASGVSRATISMIENGDQHNASLKTLCSLAKALDTTPESLFFTDAV